jgi:hypothetical protein
MNSKYCIAALALLAASFGAIGANAQYAPAENFYTAGSSAQFNTFGVAASLAIAPSAYPLCGANHWSKKNGSVAAGTQIVLHDPRSGAVGSSTFIADEPANIWIAWDNNAANGVTGAGVVCFYASVDSIVGVREYEARGSLALGANLVGTAGANLVPLIGADTTLPTAIYNIVNGAILNAANTDIRPEDALFATVRALTPIGQFMSGRGVTGLGYGPTTTTLGPIGTAIKSSQSSTIANPVAFSIVCSDTDPITGATGCGATSGLREYFEEPLGAAPVLVIANVSNTSSGHLGDGNYTNINRFELSNAILGNIAYVRDLGYTAGVSFNPYSSELPTYSQTEAAVPLSVFIREPISGTYNTMEWSIPNSLEINATHFAAGIVSGQENGINPANTTCVTVPCTVDSGNPFWNIDTYGGTRGRAIGTGEMITSVKNYADSLGYAFWGFSSYNGDQSVLKYLTVDGVDPLYSGPASNPGGYGYLPQCTSSGGLVISCPNLSFPNLVQGNYPIWSKYRLLWDPYTAATNLAETIVTNVENASKPGTGIITDLLPIDSLQVFHSHFAQQDTYSGGAVVADNGFKPGVPETGGDMGGAVLTIASELDFITDTGGNQQVGLLQ